MAEPTLAPAKPAFVPCHGAKGRFQRCPGTPPPRRRHRRKHSKDARCECPTGSKQVPSAVGRGWACLKNTQEGARFVPMTCETKSSSSARPEPVAIFTKKPARKQGKKLDWSRCDCPPGAEKQVSKSGRTQCISKTPEGKTRFVRAICKDPR